MPSQKTGRTPPVAGAVKRPQAQAMRIEGHRGPEDQRTVARQARTSEYMKAERQRQAELEKQGYCF